jgi:ATP-dependent DNA helicase RecQ
MIAREEGLPPYIVFSDKTLIDMCVKTPSDRKEMLNVSGVGAAKYEKYGERFIEAVAAFLEEHPGTATSMKDEEYYDMIRSPKVFAMAPSSSNC